MILVEVYIRITAEMAIIIPFDTKPETVVTEIPISYLLVVGDVPMYYYDNKGNPSGSIGRSCAEHRDAAAGAGKTRRRCAGGRRIDAGDRTSAERNDAVAGSEPPSQDARKIRGPPQFRRHAPPDPLPVFALPFPQQRIRVERPLDEAAVAVQAEWRWGGNLPDVPGLP